jgi:hypothetical protein
MAAAEPWIALQKALLDFVQTRDLEEGRELPPDAPTLEDRRAGLNQVWWNTVHELVPAAVPADPNAPLQFSDDARKLINFGVFPGAGLEKALASLDTGAQVQGVVLLVDSLNAVLDDVLRRDAVRGYRVELEALQRDIALWPETHLAHIRYRDAKVQELIGDNPHGAHVLRLLSETDEKLEQYKRLEARDKSGGSLSAEDRRAWGTIRHFVDSRREQIGAIIAPVTSVTDKHNGALAAAAMAASEAVEASVGHLLELHAKRRQLDEQIMEQQAAARRVTPQEVMKSLRRELDAVAGLLRLAARYARVGECATPADDSAEFIDADAAADAMAHVLCYDPRLVDNQLAARFGPPELLLAPGVGDGVFDSARNRLVVPQRCLSGAVQSLAHAAILYRLDVDAAGKALLSSYRENVHRGVRANLKLRNNLVRDYVTWMTQEALGDEVLPRKTRDWFEKLIAPDKTQPWLPVDLRGRSDSHLRQAQKELATEPESAEREYRAGVIEWLLAPTDEEAIRTRALPRLRQAESLQDTHLGAVYSAAAMYMQLKEFQPAIAAFQRFTEISPRSWWTCKAKELCALCR